MPEPGSPPSSPDTWDRARHSTTAWPRSHCHTQTRTTGTTSRSWQPSALVGCKLSRDVDDKHSAAGRDGPAAKEVGDEVRAERGAVHESRQPSGRTPCP